MFEVIKKEKQTKDMRFIHLYEEDRYSEIITGETGKEEKVGASFPRLVFICTISNCTADGA